MRSLIVVFMASSFNHLSCVAHRDEPMSIQAFIPEFAIKAFDVRILSGLAGLDEASLQFLAISPFIQCLAGKLKVIVHDH